MIPIIALVGRPNVGKSTLFNRLTRSRQALVSDFAGLTRDRQYGRATYQDHVFMLIDTGGIEGGETGVAALALQQTEYALAEADVIIFMVDAHGGLTAADQMLAQRVRLSQKPVVLVTNKVDKADAATAPAEFHQLALGTPWPISAAHNRGVTQCLAHIFSEKLTLEPASNAETAAASTIKIAILGKPNVGKSTLVNRMLGAERVIVYDQPGTTRDSIFVPMERHGTHYTLIDTAGIRRKSRVHATIEKFSILKSLQAVDAANVVIIVIDAHENITDQDLHLLGYVLESGRSLMIALNKWDSLGASEKNTVKTELARKLTFVPFAKIHYISALHGTGVGNLFDTIDRVYHSATKKHSTHLLTTLLRQATLAHSPPSVSQRRIKLKFAHAGGHNPPIIVIHGNQAESLPKDYQRYLIQYFRAALQLEGTPIQLELKTTANPFKDKKNTLTDAQARQRQRVIVHAKKEKKRRQNKR